MLPSPTSVCARAGLATPAIMNIASTQDAIRRRIRNLLDFERMMVINVSGRWADERRGPV